MVGSRRQNKSLEICKEKFIITFPRLICRSRSTKNWSHVHLNLLIRSKGRDAVKDMTGKTMVSTLQWRQDGGAQVSSQISTSGPQNQEDSVARFVDEISSVPSENEDISPLFIHQILNKVNFIKSILSSEKYGNDYHH